MSPKEIWTQVSKAHVYNFGVFCQGPPGSELGPTFGDEQLTPTVEWSYSILDLTILDLLVLSYLGCL